MSMLLKDLYNQEFYDSITPVFTKIIPDFDSSLFVKKIYADDFNSLELKQRSQRTADVFAEFMPDDFALATPIMLEIIEEFDLPSTKADSLPFLFLPEYVERFGLNHFEEAVTIIERLTVFITCEFTVRPFIVKYEDKMLVQMLAWTQHAHRRVRRLASEGARPRLPWGMALTSLKKDPAPLLPIFEALKDDECEWVRKSVANNLNDIAKDNPTVVIDFARQNIGSTIQRDKLIKHSCRTLLKKADSEVLAIFGYNSNVIQVSEFTVHTPEVEIGEYLAFSFKANNISNQPTLLRMEYAIGFLKANGTLSNKVFKISERELETNEEIEMQRKQSFKVVSTRKLNVGKHSVTLVLNGREFGTLEFELKG